MKQILIMAICLLMGGWISAQTIVNVVSNDGNTTQYTIGESGSIAFPDDYYIVLKESAESVTQQIAIDAIKKIYFEKSNTSLIAEVNKNELYLFPNPAHTHIVVSADNNELLTIYSIEGRKMAQKTIIGTQKIDITGLPQGFYLVRVGDRMAKLLKTNF